MKRLFMVLVLFSSIGLFSTSFAQENVIENDDFADGLASWIFEDISTTYPYCAGIGMYAYAEAEAIDEMARIHVYSAYGEGWLRQTFGEVRPSEISFYCRGGQDSQGYADGCGDSRIFLYQGEQEVFFYNNSNTDTSSRWAVARFMGEPHKFLEGITIPEQTVTVIFNYSAGQVEVWVNGNLETTFLLSADNDVKIDNIALLSINTCCDGRDNFYSYFDDISILPQPPPVVANAGNDVVVFDIVTLDGSESNDPDGTIISFEWLIQHREVPDNSRTAEGMNPTISDLEPGFYDVALTVTDNDGMTGTDTMLLAAAGPCFCTPSSMHVESILVGQFKAKYGKATVSIFNNCGNPVSEAEVTGTFSGDFSESGSALTDSNGAAVIYTTAEVKKPSYTFCVDDVVKGTLPYEPNDNVETCESK